MLKSFLFKDVFKNVGLGVLTYDDFDRGSNIIYGNLVMNSLENCFQTSAGSHFYNNVAMTCGSSGIQINNNQLKAGTSPRSIDIFHNTIINSATIDGSGACFKATVAGTSGVRLANNALFCPGKNAIQAVSTGISFGPNALIGTSSPASLPSANYLQSGISTYIQNSGATTDFSSAWPVISATGLVGQASSTFFPVPNTDFNCVPRSASSDIGAYQSDGLGQNPGWVFSETMRDASKCPPGLPTTTVRALTSSVPPTTTVATTTTTPVASTITTVAATITTAVPQTTVAGTAAATITTTAPQTTVGATTTVTQTTVAVATSTFRTTSSSGQPLACTVAPSAQSRVPCVLGCCLASPSRRKLQFKMSDTFSDFDCPAWFSAFSKKGSVICRAWEVKAVYLAVFFFFFFFFFLVFVFFSHQGIDCP